MISKINPQNRFLWTYLSGCLNILKQNNHVRGFMESSKVKVIVRSLLFSYILSGILLVVISFALYKLRWKESQVQMAVNAVYIFSCLAGGFLMGKGFRQKRFFCGFLAGILYFAVLFLVSLVLKRGIATTPAQLFTVMGMCVASGVIGGVLS